MLQLSPINKTLKWGAVAGVAIALLLLYKMYNPLLYGFFPKCPFFYLTGLKCPGCGSQRAIHHLLNFQIAAAFKENPMLVFVVPYIIAGAAIDRIKYPSAKSLVWRKRLFGKNAIIVIFFIVMGYWIFRNF